MSLLGILGLSTIVAGKASEKIENIRRSTDPNMLKLPNGIPYYVDTNGLYRLGETVPYVDKFEMSEEKHVKFLQRGQRIDFLSRVPLKIAAVEEKNYRHIIRMLWNDGLKYYDWYFKLNKNKENGKFMVMQNHRAADYVPMIFDLQVKTMGTNNDTRRPISTIVEIQTKDENGEEKEEYFKRYWFDKIRDDFIKRYGYEGTWENLLDFDSPEEKTFATYDYYEYKYDPSKRDDYFGERITEEEYNEILNYVKECNKEINDYKEADLRERFEMKKVYLKRIVYHANGNVTEFDA